MKWTLLLILLLSIQPFAARFEEVDIPTELEELLPDTLEPFSIEKFLANPSPNEILSQLWQYLWKEVRLHARLMGQIILIAVFAAILKETAIAFSKEASEAGFLAAYLVLILLLVSSLKDTAKLTTSTILLLGTIVQLSVPLVGAMVATGGDLVTGITISPLIIGLSAIVSLVVQKLVMPFAMASGVLGLASNVVQKPRLNRLSAFFRWLGLLILSLVNTVFFGLITSLGIGSAAQDTLVYRTTKWLVGTVPVIGTQIVGTTDLLQASTKAIQSFASTAGLLFLLFATLFPVMRLAALVLVYKLTAAVLEAIAEPRFLGALETMEKTVTFFLGLIVLTAAMFYISLGVLAALGTFILR
ncbi:MAG: hypothetical protein PHD88_05830 [Firmicutes bacterium]|nr:hypothetical protein [Bacillota bacterium]MDD4693899.1 hypothetical protein [Bacillota bacterium]